MYDVSKDCRLEKTVNLITDLHIPIVPYKLGLHNSNHAALGLYAGQRSRNLLVASLGFEEHASNGELPVRASFITHFVGV